jgi:glycosyltransferase involved in cell wall biosynthesis
VSQTELHFVVAGALDQLTGGYIYDARVVAGLRERGWRVVVHELPGRFPDPDNVAVSAMRGVLEALSDGDSVVIDGLAMGGLPEPITEHGGRLRIVSMLHHPLAEETGLSEEDAARFRSSERSALVPCMGVIVSSEFTARVLAGYGVSADRIRVVIPGTERARPTDGPPAGSPPVLLCVASLTPRKGHDVLVAALERVADLEWVCVCAGDADRDPAHADAIKRAVARAGLEDRIRFVGERRGTELRRLYRSASAFVLASRYEGYGMALAEALAHGLPVVSTTGGAIPFTVPPAAGILVQPGDVQAFAGALRSVLEPDPTLRGELAAAARSHASSLPTWEEAIQAFAVAVEDLTG